MAYTSKHVLEDPEAAAEVINAFNATLELLNAMTVQEQRTLGFDMGQNLDEIVPALLADWRELRKTVGYLMRAAHGG